MIGKMTSTGYKTLGAVVVTVAAITLAVAAFTGVGGDMGQSLPSRVTGKRANSGHTIKVSNHALTHRVIYAGIRAPYEDEQGHIDAKERNEALIAGRDLNLRYDEQFRDHKDRLMAYVFLDDGRMVNEMLVREGWAYVRLRSGTQRHAQRMIRAQSLARKEKRGIWAHTMSPSDEQFYPVDPMFAEFHLPACEVVQKLPESRRIDLNSKDEAFGRGFSPCDKCKP